MLEIADNLAEWRLLNTPLEGRAPCMYLDVKGLVTCGVGNLIDPVHLALRLPWRHGVNGPLADQQTVRDVWRVVKNCGQSHRLWTQYAPGLSDLRLNDEDIDALVDERLFANEEYLVKHHIAPEVWREIPADAQLAILSIAWACGAAFPKKFPKFWSAVLRGDWVAAKAHGVISTAGNPGVVPRNAANAVCFDNAAVVKEFGLDPDRLHWPARLGRPLVREPEPEIELIPLELPDGWLEDLRKDAIRDL